MQPSTPGVLEVITGPMFSGKSEELIRRLKRARIARQRVACYKPDIDLRYHRTAIASHSSQTHDAVPIASVEELRAELFYPQLDEVEVVGIDEVQFLRPDIIPARARSRRSRQTRHPRRPRHHLRQRALRPRPQPHGARRQGHQALRRLHGLRPARHPHPAPRPDARSSSSSAPPASTKPAAAPTSPRTSTPRAASSSNFPPPSARNRFTVGNSLTPPNLSRNDRKIYRLFLLQLLRGASITPSPARRAFLRTHNDRLRSIG